MPTFPAEERIKSRKLLEELYEKGDQLKLYPFLLKYLRRDTEDSAKVQIVISIPKKNVKKAVRRNRIRRQLKEAYRLNKADLLSQFKPTDKGLALFLIYTGKDDQSYQQLEDRLKKLLSKIQEVL